MQDYTGQLVFQRIAVCAYKHTSVLGVRLHISLETTVSVHVSAVSNMY